jgi:glycosyltransferase involved in cell wall biosynthesis
MPPQDRPLSIAYIADPNSIHVQRWIGEFLRRGHKVTLLVPRGQSIELEYPAQLAVKRYRPQTDWRSSQVGLIGTGFSVRQVIRRIRPDVVHVHHLTVNGFRAWMSGFHPYVVTVWGNDVLVEPRRSRKSRILARLVLRAADLVTGISGHVVSAAVGLGARPGRARVIHFGIDVERFSPGPDPAELRERLDLVGRRVVFSPRLIKPLYRHDVIVDALARLPEDVALLMTRYAAAPSEVAAVERRAAELGVGARVRVVPAIPHAEMPDYYRLADAVVTVPESDSGPVTLVEALGVGRPVVCSDLPPVREWMADLDPESMVPVGDVEATAAAIARVLSLDPERLVDIAQRGRAEVVRRADERLTMAEMDRLYRELASRHRPRSSR